MVKTSIYLATADGLAVVTDSEGTWSGSMHLQGVQVQCVSIGPSPHRIIYCGTFGQGVLRSSNAGATWSAWTGPENAKVTALSSCVGDTLYAGTEQSAVYRSDDRGSTWHELGSLLTLPSASAWSFPPRPETHHVQVILPDLAQPNRLHVAIEAGAMLRSDDGGRIWRDRVPSGPRDTHTLAVHPGDPGPLVSAAGDGCFQTVNDGDSWHRLVDGLEHPYCWSIAISAEDAKTLVLSASQNAFAAHYKQAARSFIYRRNEKEPWHLAMDGLAALATARIPVLAASPRVSGVFYLAAEGVVYQSANGGRLWQELPIQWDNSTATAAQHSLNMAIGEEEG